MRRQEVGRWRAGCTMAVCGAMAHGCVAAPLIGGPAWRPARACGCATWPRRAWSASCGAGGRMTWPRCRRRRTSGTCGSAWRCRAATRCASRARPRVRLARRRAVLCGLAGLLIDVHACCVHLSALPRAARAVRRAHPRDMPGGTCQRRGRARRHRGVAVRARAALGRRARVCASPGILEVV